MSIDQLKPPKNKFDYWIFILSLLLLSLVFILNGCIGSLTGPSGPGRRGDTWTVMIYLNGDNDLESQAIADINSMEMVGSTDKVKIVVQYDSLSGPAARYLIQKDNNLSEITSPVLQQLGEVNMGNWSTLVDFVRYCANKYPAEKYALILWNHGSGFKGKNISFDQTSFNDSISIPELGLALQEAKLALGRPINFLGMDACLMAMVEVAYEIRDTARILVSSQESVPGEGWDYTTLLGNLTVNPAMDEIQLARITADSYVQQFPSQNITISVTDLSQMNELVAGIGQLSRAILSDTRTSPFIYMDTGDSSQYFSDYDFIDLGDLASLLTNNNRILSPEVKTAALTISNLLPQVVLYNRTNGSEVGRSHGLSIYFPYDPYNPKYELLAFTREASWNQVIQKINAWRKFQRNPKN